MDTQDLTLLAIEDDAPMRRLLRASLPVHGYSLLEASTAREGIAEAGMRNPDLILLDLGLPDADGIDVTKQLRGLMSTPIIVLSARSEDRDKVATLDAGADDYLTKPFSISELLARIRVAHRHAERKASGKEQLTFVVGPLRVDLDKRQVFLQEQLASLTPTEYKLLAVLARNAGRVVTHQQLLKEVWGIRFGTQRQYLHVAVAQLRHKLEAEPARPRLLRTELGVGYRLQGG